MPLGLLVIFSVGMFWGCQPKEVTSAKVYIQQNDWDSAIKQLEIAVENYPENAEAHYLLGRAYGMKGRYEDMNREFDASLKADPKFANQIEFERNKYWIENFNKGVQLFNADKLDEAIEAFKIAAVIDPNRVETYRNLAVAYARTQQFDKAIEAFQQAMELDPNSPETLLNMGMVYYQMEKYEDAAKTLEKVLEIQPDNIDAVSTLGLAYHMLGETDKAISAYERALEKSPSNVDLLFNYAALLLKKGEFERAAQTFQRVLQDNPEDYDAVIAVADAFLQVAEKFTKEANKMETESENPNQEEIKKMRETAKEFYAKAIPYLEKATQLKPDNRNIWFNLGVAYIHLGEREKGEAAFKKADELEKAQKQ
ncbi:MAG: tetratricopeptide repeat protein [candidate division KSB1 bacterium]|nr:tetratricopeptide repeat protein [candidate division KSB1 bacterium]